MTLECRTIFFQRITHMDSSLAARVLRIVLIWNRLRVTFISLSIVFWTLICVVVQLCWKYHRSSSFCFYNFFKHLCQTSSTGFWTIRSNFMYKLFHDWDRISDIHNLKEKKVIFGFRGFSPWFSSSMRETAWQMGLTQWNCLIYASHRVRSKGRVRNNKTTF